MQRSVGILATGLYLPDEVRRNDWWPAELVASWSQQRRQAPPPAAPSDPTPGMRAVLEAMRAQAEDPYQGARERRCLPLDRSVYDMEHAAAEQALERSGVDRSKVGLVLSYTLVPDYLLSNPACILHQRLGLAPQCLSLQADAATYSFLSQLSLASAMIASGSVEHALLVQSSIGTRLIDREDPGSPLVGDGATAVLLGVVPDGYGFEDAVHFTDGRYPRTLIASVPGATWYDEGRARMHVADWQQMRHVFVTTADVCKQAVDALLERTRRTPEAVDFLCVYQGTPWLQRVVQDYLGMGHARTYETFERLGYLSAAMIPANLFLAEQAGALRDGDRVLLTGGGTGMTYGATLLRWYAR